MAGKAFVFMFGDVEVREREYTLKKAGETVAVEPKAFRVLLILVRNPKRLIPKEELLNAVWGDSAVTENSLTRAIALLRRLLGDNAREPRFIETVTSVGYRWLCPVEEIDDSTAVSVMREVAGEPAEKSSTYSNFATPIADKNTVEGRSGPWKWIAITGGATAILLASVTWYLNRPLSPPRITAYTAVTHDGRDKRGGFSDGSRIYFLFSSPRSIAQVDAAGGETAAVPVNITESLSFPVDLSPDGSELLVESYSGKGDANTMWKVRILGGSAKRIAAAESGSFSPDGRSIVYATVNGDIFEVGSDGSAPRKLASTGGYVFRPAWSPNGKVIRFEKDGKLWEMNADGSGSRPLLPNWRKEGEQTTGAWTPDGKLYLFLLGGPSPDGDQIWALDERHRWPWQRPSVPIQLTNGPIRWSDAIPSHDGKKIIAAGRTPRGELTRIDTKTGRGEPFLNGISADSLTFSKDGKSVAFVSFPEGNLFKAKLDGSEKVQLTEPPMHPILPRWSPDGSQIVFSDGYFGVRFRFYTISPQASTPQEILPSEDGMISDPNWSADGKKIVYCLGTLDQHRTEELRILDMESRRVQSIPGSKGLYSPRWSPDGRFILGIDRKSAELHILDTSLQKWSVVKTTGTVSFPSFSSDSKEIYFLRYGSDQGIYRAPISGGSVERVVDMKNLHITGSLGVYLGLDPTDAPLVLRDTGTYDIYAITLVK